VRKGLPKKISPDIKLKSSGDDQDITVRERQGGLSGKGEDDAWRFFFPPCFLM
jgi:hypothetical protein